MPFGKRFDSSSILSLTRCCRSSALEPGIWKTASTTVGSSPKKAEEAYCSAPSSMRATSRNRTTEPAAGSARTTMSPNCCGIAQPADGVDLHLEGGAVGRRRLADLARRDLDVLLGDGVLHVDGGDAEIGELVGIEPDAHRIAPLAEDLHVADARAGASADRPPADRRSCSSATGSTEPSGEVRLTIRTKFGFCFLIVTPA